MTNQTKPETPAGRPLGDTGDGNTGVPDDEQGISNRPGDRGQDADIPQNRPQDPHRYPQTEDDGGQPNPER